MRTNAEFESLNNWSTTLGLTLNVYLFDDKRKNRRYFLSLNGCSVSPVMDYNELNCFMNGWSNCLKSK